MTTKALALAAGALLLAGAFFLGGWLGGLLFTPLGEILFWQFLVFGLVVVAFLAMVLVGLYALVKGVFG